MNKGELVDLLAAKTKTTKKEASAFLDAFIDSVTRSVIDGDKVTLVGFGSFELREYKTRSGRNPKTGESMQIPAAVIPKFTAGKNFRDAVNQ